MKMNNFLMKEQMEMTSNTSKPLVSLLVAVRNEKNYIQGCLQSIINQDYPQESLEVIIADGLSTDSTVSIINKLIDGRKNYKLIEKVQVDLF